MHSLDPIVTVHPLTGAQRQVTPDLLREAYLVPTCPETDPAEHLARADAPWAASHEVAPLETRRSVMAGLRALILATARLEPGEVALSRLPEETRLGRHVRALVELWEALADGLPEDLQVMRHVIASKGADVLEPLPIVDTGPTRFATKAEASLRDALLSHHGPASDAARNAWHAQTAPLTCGAQAESVLHLVQDRLLDTTLEPRPHDGSLSFWGVRDPAEEAELAAAIVQRKLDAGSEPADIALLVPDDNAYHRHLRRAFEVAGVHLSGLSEPAPQRDLPRETLLHFLLALQTPVPVMALASLHVSPLMPWSAETGAALAREVMQGRFEPRIAERLEGRSARLFRTLRSAPRDAAAVSACLDVLAQTLTDDLLFRDAVAALRAHLPVLKSKLGTSGQPDWDALFEQVTPQTAAPTAGERFVEGVSVIAESGAPWRPAQHLIVLGMAAGRYPRASGTSPLFLDSERDALRAATGLHLTGRGDQLARRLELFRRQLCVAAKTATFLCPMRGLDGARQGPSTALSLIARAVQDPAKANGVAIDEPDALIADLRALSPTDWPCAHRRLPRSGHDMEMQRPAGGVIETHSDLFTTRRDSAGRPRRQSPSRLETLLVSPLAWALAEFGADEVIWSPEAFDHILSGTLAHEAFEHLFPKDSPLPDADTIRGRVPAVLAQAIRRHAPFLQAAIWRVERQGLERDVSLAAIRWSEALDAAGAKVIDNEIALMGDVHGLKLYGRADCLLRLPDGRLVIVDHKKAGSAKRRERMEAGWDLQVALYRAMLLRPDLEAGQLADALATKPQIGVAYHLINDGGILLHGIDAPAPVFEMVAEEISSNAVALLNDRIAEVGSGRIRLNTVDDAAFFEKSGKFTPYALNDSTLVVAFLVPGEACDE